MMPRYAAVDGIRAVDFDDECIVFNPLSWDAHLLNTAAAAVLDLLTTGSKSAADVEAYLRELLLESERDNAPAHSHRLLNELTQLGLVHEVTLDPDGATPR